MFGRKRILDAEYLKSNADVMSQWIELFGQWNIKQFIDLNKCWFKEIVVQEIFDMTWLGKCGYHHIKWNYQPLAVGKLYDILFQKIHGYLALK